MDRGNKLWEGHRVILPEHRELLFEHKQKEKEYHPPELAEDLRHPSLQARKLTGREYIWYCRADRDLRITFQFDETGDIVLRNCGHHDPTLKKP